MKLFRYRALLGIIKCNKQLRYAFPLFLLLPLVIIGSVIADDHSPCTGLPAAQKLVTVVRGLTFKGSVGCLVKTEKQIEAYVISMMRKEYSPHKIALEGIAFEMLGIISEAKTYEKTISDLYRRQLGGLYDPTKKAFYIAAGIPQDFLHKLAVHELTHALQDQYFDLNAFVDPKKYTSDEIQARMAVVEGDASLVALDEERDQKGLPPLSQTGVDSGLALEFGAEMDPFLGNQYPEALQYFVIFPYRLGMRFVHAQLLGGGYTRVDELFKKPPRSTEEILHHEKYKQELVDFKNPTVSEVQSVIQQEGNGTLYDDVIGEFGIRALFTALLKDEPRAKTIAEGWGGDRIVLFKGRQKPSYELAWLTRWDQKSDAQEFYQGLQRLFGTAELFPGWNVWRRGIGVRAEINGNTVVVQYRRVI